MNRFDGLFNEANQKSNEEGKLKSKTSKHPDIQTSKSKNPEYQRTTIYLPKDLHRRFKSESALRGKDMSDIVSELLECWLENSSA